MRFSRLMILALASFIIFAGQSRASLIMYSENPNVPAGVYLYEDRSAPYDGLGVPFYPEYGAAPRTVFTPEDRVYIGAALDAGSLAESDMIVRDGVKYCPTVWWQIWAPGADTTGQATFEYRETSDITWDLISGIQQDYPGWHAPIWWSTYFPSLDPVSDLWTLAGGYQPGEWQFRFSVERPTEETDPWATYCSDGSWYITYSDDLSAAPLSGSATAAPVPEPSTMLLLGSGLLFLARRKRHAKV